MSTNSALTEESKRVVTAMYDAGVRGDFAGVMSQMDENLIVYEPPFLPYGGLTKGSPTFLRSSKV